MYWIDTHCHLYDAIFQPDFGEVVAQCYEKKVQKIFLPNIHKDSIYDAIQLQNQYSSLVYIMNGLHPCYVDETWQEEWSILERLFDENTFVAMGEIGLDYYHNAKHTLLQKEVLALQIEKALTLNLPIILHTRNAVKDCVEMLHQYASPKLRGIFHCFSEGYEYIDQIMNLGFYFGIGGIATFKKSSLADALQKIPLERMVLETDAPYLAPQPFRGKRNIPSYIPLIGECVARLKNVPIEKVAQITSSNAEKIFFNVKKEQ